jgi:neutral ceramidase
MRMLTCLLFSCLAAAALAGEESKAPMMRVGAAAVDITPKPGTPMAGYYRFRAVEGVRDPLYAKAIVLEQEGSLAALVTLDLVSTSRPVVEQARELIRQQSGIAPERVLISATHTHTGPQLPRDSLMDEITRANAPEGLAYMKALPLWIAEAVAKAKAGLAPAGASAAIGKVQGISFNRRVLRDGSSQAIWQPRTIDQAKERPAGPIDPDLGLLVFERADEAKSPIAAYVNFAMHPTSLGGGQQVSADYPGVLTRLLSERNGGNLVALFANGCCGNINHTDYITGTRRTTEQLGTALADVASKIWPQRERLTTFAPRARSAMVKLERRRFSEAQIDKAKEIARRMLTESLGTVPMAEAVCILETVAKQEVPLEGEVQTIALSDELAIVALPGEIFVELGLAIKAVSPFRYTFIAELANGSIGYIPNLEAYPQGNYEIVSARGEAGSGERLVEAALNLLRELKTTE